VLSISRRLDATLAPLRPLLDHRPLAGLLLASFAWTAADAAFVVGLLVVAFADGGPAAVALVSIVRAVPSVALAPVVARSRFLIRPGRAIRRLLVVRIGAIAIAALGLAFDWPLWTVLAVIAVDGIAGMTLRPLRLATLPDLARSPEELVAANLGMTVGDSAAALVGPAISDGRLWAIDRETFLGAVTGHGESRAAAEAVACARLTAAGA